jgi:hypothetical protein
MSTVVQTQLLSIRLKVFYFFLLILGILALPAGTASAQGLSSEGKEYWIGFMPNWIVPAQALSIYVGTGTPNKIKVETFGEGGKIVSSQSITLGADQTYKFKMSVGLSETRERELPVYHAIRVTSTAPCVVYGYSDNSLTTDGYLALPLSGLGKEYYSFNYYDDKYFFLTGSEVGGEFLIVAPYDGTQVTITTKANTTNDEAGTVTHDEGTTWKVTLNRGQTYLVQTTGNNYGVDDLTGSKVTSTKPIGFLTGHQRAEIELEEGDGNSKDHLIEMIPPTDRWGTEYFMMPQNSRTVCGDYIRVVSAEDGNRITVNGSERQLNAGDWFEVSQQTVPTTFTSINDKKFFVMDYSYEQGHFGDPAQGDPFIVSLIPKEQFQKRIIFRTPSNVGTAFKHYATIVYHKDFIGKVTLKKGNNAPATLSAFGAGSPVSMPKSDYVAQRVTLSADEVTWIAEAPTPMGIYLYGYTSVESYGYPAGMALKVVSNDPMAPLETRVEDCGDNDVELTETHLMPKDAWDDTHIAEVYMVTEPKDVNWNKPSYNYVFTLDPKFVVGAETTTFTLRVIDKTKDAYAAIYTYDQAGNDSLYEYFYEAPKLGATPEPEYVFAPVLVDQDSCMEITLRNDQTNGDVEISNASIMGVARGGSFKVTPATINKTLKPGETFKLTVCFTANDTVMTTDTLIVETACAPFKFALRGEGVIPKIFATDKYFGLIPKGTTRCEDIRITNQGRYTLKINAQDLDPGHPNFKINTAQSFSWPLYLAPNESEDVSFCLTPTEDSGDYAVRITYATNIPARFKELNKNYSLLGGISRRAGAQLTVLNQGFGPTNCIDRPTYIDTLYNDGQLDMTIYRVVIEGTGAASYKIVSSNPTDKLVNFVLSPSPKEAGIKYLVQFDPTVAPDETPQLAKLIAYTDRGAVPITNLSGSRIAPVLTVVAGAPIDFGSIKTNTTKPMYFDVVNTGSAVLNVVGISKSGADAANFTVAPTTFTLQPGGTQQVTVTFAPGAESRDFTAKLRVEPSTPSCTTPQDVDVIGKSNQNDYTASGADYQTVFTCKDRTLDGSFGNTSTEQDILITDIQIVGTDRADFSLASAPALPITVAKGNGKITVPVIFTPTSTGPKLAGLRFSFELEGQQKDTIVELKGVGDLVPQVVAVGDVNGNVKYTATMNDQLTVPIKLSESFQNRNADVRGYSFDVSFKRDAFNFDQGATGPTNVTVTKQFKSYDPVTDMETYTISTQGISPTELTIDNNTFAAELNLLPRLHRGLESPIEVSNAAWLDQNNGVICYIPTTYVPATYQFDPLCGDNALQAYLNDKSIKEIAFGYITPNPVRKDAEINFDVNVDGDITLSVYDALGTEIAKVLTAEPMKTGKHTAKFDASTLAEGTYYCRLSNGHSTLTQKMVIAK